MILQRGRAFDSQVILSTTATNSSGIKTEYTGLRASILLSLNDSAHTTLIYQNSFDGTNYYTPVNSSNSALSTLIGARSVIATMVYFEPSPAPYMRFQLTVVPSRTATLDYCIDEEVA